jgi:hypothetical protein
LGTGGNRRCLGNRQKYSPAVKHFPIDWGRERSVETNYFFCINYSVNTYMNKLCGKNLRKKPVEIY